MERVIGIRVHPSFVYYSILEVNDDNTVTILDVSKVVIPNLIDVPNKLTFIRNTLATIIMEYDISIAGIRLNETIAQSPSHFRINIEGVIQELFANSSINSYFCGNISSISSALKESTKIIKAYIDGSLLYEDIEDWKTKYKNEERETILIAISALENGGIKIA